MAESGAKRKDNAMSTNFDVNRIREDFPIFKKTTEYKAREDALSDRPACRKRLPQAYGTDTDMWNVQNRNLKFSNKF